MSLLMQIAEHHKLCRELNIFPSHELKESLLKLEVQKELSVEISKEFKRRNAENLDKMDLRLFKASLTNVAHYLLTSGWYPWVESIVQEGAIVQVVMSLRFQGGLPRYLLVVNVDI